MEASITIVRITGKIIDLKLNNRIVNTNAIDKKLTLVISCVIVLFKSCVLARLPAISDLVP